MNTSPLAATPRRVAYDILHRIDRERSYADILIHHELNRGVLKGPDRSLLTELVYGTLRRQGTLDYLIGLFANRGPAKLERSVLHLLRLGLYQLFFLDRIPPSAAVNESVTLAHTLAPRAAGFINAVLRQADRQRNSVRYPDPETDFAAYLAARHSHPRWLAEKWESQLGRNEAEELAAAMSSPPPLTLRVNTLKITREDFTARLLAAGIEASPGRYAATAVHVGTGVAIPSLPGFAEGLFAVQDESSQMAALFLSPRPGERLLDLCAAPGGKTAHLAQLMKNEGKIIACDVTAKKLRLVTEAAERLGIGIIETRAVNATKGPLPFTAGEFDRLLLDAPCSGLGVLRRNPEGKWWKTEENVRELATVQKQLLANAAPLVREGGTLLYATCSTSREENEEVIDDFLSLTPGFVLENLSRHFPEEPGLFTSEGYFRSWPHRHGMDGFFAARLRKSPGETT